MPAFKPIQIIPPGLLGFFQLKQEGRGIVEIPDVLQGSIDLFRWFLQARQEGASNVTSATLALSGRDYFESFGATSTLRVPEKEFWYVHEYRVGAAPGPGIGTARVNHLACAMAQNPTNQSNPVSFGDTVYNDPGAADMTANDLVVVFARDFFAPAGCELGFSYSQTCTAGGNVVYSGNCRLTRLPI